MVPGVVMAQEDGSKRSESQAGIMGLGHVRVGEAGGAKIEKNGHESLKLC
jgi:hypothetical protein